jgi:hypothetical protein
MTEVHTIIGYTCRDKDNYKQHEQLVFPGRISEIERARKTRHLHNRSYFIPSQERLPDLQGAVR